MELEVIIGLEIHAQISTTTGLFCGCSLDSFGAKPNINVCPVCTGMPGAIPYPNKDAVRKAAIAALSLNCKVNGFSKFDRKNYFYPDLPLGFQISQFDQPISEHGYVEIDLEGERKKIRVTRLHLENDAGKLTHTGNSTLVDYNRSGAPLMEIVSEPDIRSAKEARLYAEMVQKILRYADASDCDMEKGKMRFDASVSLREKGTEKLNPRAEIKNLNSFRSLEAAIQYEIKRQTKMWEAGEPLAGEQTVGWDDDRGTTEVMREKESAADYRYFPEPDIPPIELTPEQIQEWSKLVEESPLSKYERFQSEYEMNDFDATFYTEDLQLAKLFEAVYAGTSNLKATHSFISTILVKSLKDAGLSLADSPVEAQHLVELIKLIDSGEISNNVAKSTVFEAMMKSGDMPSVIVEREGLKQVSDTSAIEAMCKAAIEANPKAAEDVRNGEMKAIGALVGFVMKESKGSANPKLVNQVLKNLL